MDVCDQRAVQSTLAWARGSPMKRTALPQPTKRRPHKPDLPATRLYRPALGEQVQVTAGQLAGMKGIVVDAATTDRCVVQLDGVETGVLLAIDSKWLKRATKPRS
jgi:hypothetical protein